MKEIMNKESFIEKERSPFLSCMFLVGLVLSIPFIYAFVALMILLKKIANMGGIYAETSIGKDEWREKQEEWFEKEQEIDLCSNVLFFVGLLLSAGTIALISSKTNLFAFLAEDAIARFITVIAYVLYVCIFYVVYKNVLNAYLEMKKHNCMVNVVKKQTQECENCKAKDCTSCNSIRFDEDEIKCYKKYMSFKKAYKKATATHEYL